MARFPGWQKMNWIRLVEGPHDRTELAITPTMRNFTYRGVPYFRMPDSRAVDPQYLKGAGIEPTEYGGLYLWKDWGLSVARREKDAPEVGGPLS